jgi:uncharacterized low-complexity protein
MIGIAVRDPITRVNPLSFNSVERSHKRATRKLAQMPGPPQSHMPWIGKIYAPEGRCPEGRCPEGRCPEGRCPEGRCPEGRCPEGRCGENFSPGPLTSGRALFISTRNLALALGEC